MADDRLSEVERPGADIIMDPSTITAAPPDTPISAPAAMRPHQAGPMKDYDKIAEEAVEELAGALLGWEGHAADCTDDCLADAKAFVRDDLLVLVKKLTFDAWAAGYSTGFADSGSVGE